MFLRLVNHVGSDVGVSLSFNPAFSGTTAHMALEALHTVPVRQCKIGLALGEEQMSFSGVSVATVTSVLVSHGFSVQPVGVAAADGSAMLMFVGDN